MKVHSLLSGSSGNAFRVFSDSTDILIDAGASYKRLCEANGSPLEPQACFITHDHGDHVGGAGVLGRKTGAKIYIPQASYEAREKIFKNCDIEYIQGGDRVHVGDFTVQAFSSRHDSHASVGYTVLENSTGVKCGYLTDSGSFNKVMKESLKGCNVYLLEANYDLETLENFEDYDPIHKDRIKSPFGHLDNDQTMDFIEENLDLEKVSHIAFGHLSRNTNSPEMVMELAEKRFPKYKDIFTCAPHSETLEITK